MEYSRPNNGARSRIVAKEVWEVVLPRRYFAGGANKRYDRWDVGVRQSKTGVLGLTLIACHTWDGARTGGEPGGSTKIMHTLIQ